MSPPSKELGFDATDLALIVTATGLCPFCAARLRSNQARQCPTCKLAWHKFDSIKNLQLAPMFQLPRDVLRLRNEITVLKSGRDLEIAWMYKTKSISKYMFAFVTLLFLLAFISFMVKGVTFIGASYLIGVVTLVIFGLIVYLSFVFRRVITMDFQLMKKWLALKFSSSDRKTPKEPA